MDYSDVERKIGCVFKDKLLLTEALTHPSYLNENRLHPVPDYQRLEFLGDAILDLVVTEYIFRRFPAKAEGELTELRSYLVRGKLAFQVAKSLGMGGCVLISKGFLQSSNAYEIILADAFEAVIGALYLDQGLEKVREFIHKTILTEQNIRSGNVPRDPKSVLQEQIQGKNGATPTYEVLHDSGPEHAKEFVVGVYVGTKLIGKGKGHSKIEAARAAATQALASRLV